MKHGLKMLLAAGALALGLGGCAYLPDSPATQDAKTAVGVALTTYTQIYQPAVIAYGRLPACPAAALCHDVKIFADLAAADAAVNASAQAARQVLNQNLSNPGALQNVVTAIQTAQLKIAASGIMKKDQ